MGWEQRGNERYYYRKRREGGHVISEYIGKGEIAELLAKMDMLDRAKRDGEQADAKAETDHREELDTELHRVSSIVETLLKASLLAEGCHTHKGQWRRQRAQRAQRAHTPKPKRNHQHKSMQRIKGREEREDKEREEDGG